MTKICFLCETEKDVSEFVKNKGKPGGIESRCRECSRIYQRNHYDPIKRRVVAKEYGKRNRDKILSRKLAWDTKNPHYRWAGGVLRVHKTRGFKIEISVRQLRDIAIQTPLCQYCAKPLKWGSGRGERPRHDTPTMDRLRNEGVVTTENIRIVCYQCNMGKGQETLEQYIEHCKAVVKHNNEVHP